MKKKIVTILILSVTVVAALSGCKGLATTETEYDTESKSIKSMFVEVEVGAEWRIMYDKKTKVMYVMSDGPENRGGFTELVDENGKPKLWENEEE